MYVRPKTYVMIYTHQNISNWKHDCRNELSNEKYLLNVYFDFDDNQ